MKTGVRHTTAILAIILVSYFMILLDNSIIFTASLGLVIGGAFADWVSWRAGFFVKVPVGAAMIVLAPRFLPESSRSRGRFDLTSAASATLGVGALVYGIIHSASSGWGTAATVIPVHR